MSLARLFADYFSPCLSRDEIKGYPNLLSPRDRERVAFHLDVCPDCSKRHRKLMRLVEMNAGNALDSLAGWGCSRIGGAEICPGNQLNPLVAPGIAAGVAVAPQPTRDEMGAGRSPAVADGDLWPATSWRTAAALATDRYNGRLEALGAIALLEFDAWFATVQAASVVGCEAQVHHGAIEKVALPDERHICSPGPEMEADVTLWVRSSQRTGRIERVRATAECRSASQGRWEYRLRIPADKATADGDLALLGAEVYIPRDRHWRSERTSLGRGAHGDLETEFVKSELPPDMLGRLWNRQPTVVAFAVVGSGLLPDPAAFNSDPKSFAKAMKTNPPHMLMHLEITQCGTHLESKFGPLSTDRLKELYERLGLAALLPRDAGISVRLCEYERDKMPESCSPWAYPAPAIRGECYSLALTAGLVGCVTQTPPGAWVVFTGVVDPMTLDVRRVERIVDKLRLIRGGHGQAQRFEMLHKEVYCHDNACEYLGPEQQRVLPGHVKMTVVPLDNVDDFFTSAPDFNVTPLNDVGWKDFLNESFETVPDRVAELAREGMLIVAVRHVSDALRLVGYDRRYSFPPSCEAGPLRVFRLTANRPVTVDPTAATEMQNWFLARLEEKMGAGRDIYERLRSAMEFCSRALDRPGHHDLFSALIAYRDGDCDFVRVIPSGTAVEAVPYRLPAWTGITGEALRSGKTQVVHDTSTNCHYFEALEASSKLEAIYGRERAETYRQHLESIKSCIKVPLRSRGRVCAVLCLHSNAPRHFDDADVRLVECLAARIEDELGFLLGWERSACLAEPMGDLAETLAGKLARCPVRSEGTAGAQPSLALADIADQLAREAMRNTGAYRAAVRVIQAEEKTLVVVGYAGGPTAYPDWFLKGAKPLADETAAATFAIRTRQNYALLDTVQLYEAFGSNVVHYEPVPPEARSHATILIRHCGHVLGVLSIDWEEPGRCTPGTMVVLERLVEQHATALRAAQIDSLMEIVDRLVDSASPDGLDYRAFLKNLTLLLNVQQAAIFMRRRDTGLFHLEFSLQHPEWSGDDNWYAIRQGVTGWVLAKNRTVRIADLSDRAELLAIDPHDPPRWEDKLYDAPTRTRTDLSYLAAPVSVGEEVLGVVRFACGSTREGTPNGFSSYDQTLVSACAARLAAKVFTSEQKRRDAARRQFATSMSAASSQEEFVDAIIRCIAQGLGKNTTSIALVTRLFRTSWGGEAEALLRIGASDDGEWDEVPLFRRRNQGIAGRVWETGSAFRYDDYDDESLMPFNRADPPVVAFVHRFRSGYCAPMIVDEHCIGTLFVCRRNPGALTHCDRAFIDDITATAASAARSVNRREQARVRGEVRKYLLQRLTGQKNARGLDEVALIQAVAERLSNCFDLEAVAVWKLEPDGAFYRMVTSPYANLLLKDRVAFADVKLELPNDASVVVIDPKDDARLRALFFRSDEDDWEENLPRRAAFTLGGGNWLILLVPIATRWLQYERVERVRRLFRTAARSLIRTPR